MMMKTEHRRSSDAGWRRFLTAELSATVLVSVFIAGGIWVSLSEDMIQARVDINKHAVDFTDLSVHVTRMDSDIRLIAADAVRNKEVAQEIKDELKDQRADIKEILIAVTQK